MITLFQEDLASGNAPASEVRESVRAKLRTLVRRALKRWKYPPDKAPEAIELILQQAERLCPNWV